MKIYENKKANKSHALDVSLTPPDDSSSLKWQFSSLRETAQSQCFTVTDKTQSEELLVYILSFICYLKDLTPIYTSNSSSVAFEGLEEASKPARTDYTPLPVLVTFYFGTIGFPA